MIRQCQYMALPFIVILAAIAVEICFVKNCTISHWL